MGFLSVEELSQLLPAETSAYPSPIPTQSVSSDEFMPAPQSAKQREFEARIKEIGGELARRQGMSPPTARSGAPFSARTTRGFTTSIRNSARRWRTIAPLH
jgi:hypothetical protein